MKIFTCPFCGEQSDEIGIRASGANLYHYDVSSEESDFKDFEADGGEKYYCINCGQFVTKNVLNKQGINIKE